jgi:hypothetical protein
MISRSNSSEVWYLTIFILSLFKDKPEIFCSFKLFRCHQVVDFHTKEESTRLQHSIDFFKEFLKRFFISSTVHCIESSLYVYLFIKFKFKHVTVYEFNIRVELFHYRFKVFRNVNPIDLSCSLFLKKSCQKSRSTSPIYDVFVS